MQRNDQLRDPKNFFIIVVEFVYEIAVNFLIPVCTWMWIYFWLFLSHPLYVIKILNSNVLQCFLSNASLMSGLNGIQQNSCLSSEKLIHQVSFIDCFELDCNPTHTSWQNDAVGFLYPFLVLVTFYKPDPCFRVFAGKTSSHVRNRVIRLIVSPTYQYLFVIKLLESKIIVGRGLKIRHWRRSRQSAHHLHSFFLSGMSLPARLVFVLIISCGLVNSCFLNSCPYRRYGRTVRCSTCGIKQSTNFQRNKLDFRTGIGGSLCCRRKVLHIRRVLRDQWVQLRLRLSRALLQGELIAKSAADLWNDV